MINIPRKINCVFNNLLKAKSCGNVAVAASTINIQILKLSFFYKRDNPSNLSDFLTEHGPYLLGRLFYLHSLVH